jgi:hypothetical protein
VPNARRAIIRLEILIVIISKPRRGWLCSDNRSPKDFTNFLVVGRTGLKVSVELDRTEELQREVSLDNAIRSRDECVVGIVVA